MLRRVLISDTHRLLFVHVQKTGGTTISHRLQKVLPDARTAEGAAKHATLGQVLREDPSLHGYWTFGFVRNPWARMLSWYRMVERVTEEAAAGNANKARLLEKVAFIAAVAEQCPDFESFVMTGPDRWSRVRTPQVQYLTSKHRRADLIGRQETLEADLRAVFARFELPWEGLTDINVDAERPDYRDWYTPAMRDRVAEVYARDIELFGYRF